jgi:hypothetical protein
MPFWANLPRFPLGQNLGISRIGTHTVENTIRAIRMIPHVDHGFFYVFHMLDGIEFCKSKCDNAVGP